MWVFLAGIVVGVLLGLWQTEFTHITEENERVDRWRKRARRYQALYYEQLCRRVQELDKPAVLVQSNDDEEEVR